MLMSKRRSYGKTNGKEKVTVKEQFNPPWADEWMNEWKGHEVEVNDASVMTVGNRLGYKITDLKMNNSCVGSTVILMSFLWLELGFKLIFLHKILNLLFPIFMTVKIQSTLI